MGHARTEPWPPGGGADLLDQAETIGQRIKACRKQAGLNQGALADRLGVTQPTVANWEAGVHDPRQLMLAKLADALDVSLGWLAGGERSEAERDKGASAPYMRRPIQHVPVLTAEAAVAVAQEGTDPHEAATDYVPVTYGGGRLAAVFLAEGAMPEDAVPRSDGRGTLFIVDYERRDPAPGETVLLCTEAGLIAREWPRRGRRERPCATVVASIRFH